MFVVMTLLLDEFLGLRERFAGLPSIYRRLSNFRRAYLPASNFARASAICGLMNGSSVSDGFGVNTNFHRH